MPYSDTPIRPLPPEVAARVRSSVQITNLNEVVLELVKNALDADARSIDVVVDFRRGGLVVEDDGHGILSAEFNDGSGLCKAHNTSKIGRQSVFGCKGLFLSALATMSLLTITSRHSGQLQTNSLVFHHAEIISRFVPAPSHQAIRANQGTRITVNNLFGNMPVRLKHRASTLQRPEDLDKEWEELKRMLIALILPNERLRKLRVSDSDKSRVMNLRIPQLSSDNSGLDTTRLQMILTQSGLMSSSKMGSWVTMSANTPELSIEAYVSLSPSHTKLNQFISFGIDPIFPAHNSANPLYNEVNQLFAASDFGSTNSEPLLKGVLRGGPRWPMFYIRVGLSSSWKLSESNERTVESDRSLQHVIDVLDELFHQFLQQHHFRPRRTGHTPQIEGATNEKDGSIRNLTATRKQPPRDLRNFSSWSRVKSADDQAYSDLFSSDSKGRESLPAKSWTPRTDLRQLQSSYFSHTSPDTLNAEAHLKNSSLTLDECADKLISWVEPGTNDEILVNSRTGQCLPRETMFDKSKSEWRPRSTGAVMSNPSRGFMKRPQSAPVGKQSVWLESLMYSWENPVFSRPETPIMSIAATSHDKPHAADHARDDHLYRQVSSHGKSLDRSSGKLSREKVATACIIGQVDRKFILVRMSHNQGLVLVDQHAADERCRLEQLFSDMFKIEGSDDGSTWRTSIRIYELQVPLQIEIEEQEIHPFTNYMEYFASWGCRYKVNPNLDTNNSTILVTTLPIGIAERCRLEPTLVAELLRKGIWNRAGDRIPKKRFSSFKIDLSKRSFPWLDVIAGCPEGIIDLLNSRACRTAIMFNDNLSRTECANLVSRLSCCAFPFQCAHGRPSMIPVADESLFPSICLRSISYHQNEGHHEPEPPGFLEAFKKWDHQLLSP
ncbi:hypothetical protein BGW36DRAFT_302929 [Talaromyces proteolyticus]|uniref:MutL C-terminal dimerisation domain-containing protein n=1 Tax=Talaromyces proteolyticus TaxID=1131652 RepID=A0AAD4PXV3_9EURO|nr:uncharacterized protein BGW36DRAFT_302929 [Talaromyces proteolyticus]KAH8693168.1 hypothetical protein BGW36DRAFT_302929 [Talaromyces proteolyticus]